MSEHFVNPESDTSLAKPVLWSASDQPNLPEVSGTSFPLLTTVLAGFAVTIAIQLIIRPDDPAELPGRLVTAIVVFLASTLLFISSIVFAVNAQAHNYLPFLVLDESSTRTFGITDRSQWISSLHHRWNSFHIAAIATFYGGILLLLGGVNLVVWEFVGEGVALVFLILILSNLVLTIVVSLVIEGRKHRSSPVGNETHERIDAQAHSTVNPNRNQQDSKTQRTSTTN